MSKITIGFSAEQLLSGLKASSSLSQQLGQDIKNLKVTFTEFSGAGDLVSAKLQQVAADGRVFITTFKDVGGTLKEVKNDFVGMVPPLKTMGDAFVHFLGFRLAFKGFGEIFAQFKEGINDAAELSKRVGEIQTISLGSNIGGEDEITKRILEISGQAGKGTKEITEATYQALSSGLFKGKDAIDAVAKSMGFFRTTMVDAGAGMKVLTAVMNANGLETSELTRVHSVLYSMVENGQLRIKDLDGVMGRLGAVSKNVGISLEEQAAALSTLTQKGIETHTAQTFLVNIFTTLEKGGKDVRKMFEEEGVSSIEAFINKFGGLGGALQHIIDKLNENNEATTKVFTNVRGLTGVLALAGDGFAKYGENLEKVKTAQDRFDQANETMANNMGVRIDRIKTAWANLFTSIGHDFLLGTGIIAGKIGLEGFGTIQQTAKERADAAIDKQVAADKLAAEKAINDEYSDRRRQLAEILATQNKILDDTQDELKLLKEQASIKFEGMMDGLKRDARETQNEIQKLNRLIDDIKKNRGLTASGGVGRGGFDEVLFRTAEKYESDPTLKLKIIDQEIERLKQKQQALIAKGDADSLKAAQSLNKEIENLVLHRLDVEVEGKKRALQEWARQNPEEAAARGTLEVTIDMAKWRRILVDLAQQQLNVDSQIEAKAKETLKAEEAKKDKKEEEIRTLARQFKDLQAITLTDKKGEPLSAEDRTKALQKFDELQKQIVEGSALRGENLGTRIQALQAIGELRKRLDQQANDIIYKQGEERRDRELKAEQENAIKIAKARIDAIASARKGDVLKEADTNLTALQERITQARSQGLLPLGETFRLRGEIEGIKESFKGSVTVGSLEKAKQDLQDVSAAVGVLKNKFLESGRASEDLISTLDQIEKNLAAESQKAGWDALKLSIEAAADATRKYNILQGGGVLNYNPAAPVPGFAEGGMFYGAPGIDTNLAALTSGEYIVNPNSTSKFFSQLQAINAGRAPEFPSQQPTSSTTVGDINIIVQGGSTHEQTVRNIGYALRREIRRKTLTFD